MDAIAAFVPKQFGNIVSAAASMYATGHMNSNEIWRSPRKTDDWVIVVVPKILRLVSTSPLMNAVFAWILTLIIAAARALNLSRQTGHLGPDVWILVSYGILFVASSFYAAIRTYSAAERYVAKMIRLYVAVLLAFANVYFVLLVSLPEAFVGIASPWVPFRAWEIITFKSTLLSAVDCIHFSCVTITTLGFGDMHPSHWLAKLITDVEVLTGLGLVAIGVGRVLSVAVERPR